MTTEFAEKIKTLSFGFGSTKTKDNHGNEITKRWDGTNSEVTVHAQPIIRRTITQEA